MDGFAKLSNNFKLLWHENTLLGVNQHTLAAAVMPLTSVRALELFDGRPIDEVEKAWPLRDIEFRDFIEMMVGIGAVDDFSGPPTQKFNLGDNSAQQKITPEVRILKIVEGCNLNCSYCYDSTFEYVKKMPVESIEKSIDFIFQIRKSAWIHLHFHGGEPLVHWEGIERGVGHALNAAERIGVHVTFAIGTNGILLNEARLRWLRDKNVALRISYDGRSHDENRKDKRGIGSSHLVVGAINMLRESAYSNWTLLNTVNSSNVSDMLQYLGDCANLCVPSVVYQPVRRQGNAQLRPDLAISGAEYADGIIAVAQAFSDGSYHEVRCDTVLTLLRPLLTGEGVQGGCGGSRCGAGSSVLAIDTDNTVGACDTLPRGSLRTLGHVGDDISVKALALTLAARVDGNVDCRRCPWLKACNGGCPGSALSDDGDFNKKHRFTCDFSLQIYPKLIRMLASSSGLSTYFRRHFLSGGVPAADLSQFSS